MDRIERIRQSFITKKAEKSDTHDYIQRHDPEFHKKESNVRDHWQDHDDDMTDISVESLIVFLEGLKRENTNFKKDVNEDVDPSMKQAIAAYEKDKPTAQKRYTYLDEDEQNVDPATIDKLIASLNHLLAHDIDHITLIPADSFLTSIEKTVEKYEGM